MRDGQEFAAKQTHENGDNEMLMDTCDTKYNLNELLKDICDDKIHPEIHTGDLIGEENLALTLNTKKKKIKRKDFETSFNLFEIPQKAQDNIFAKFQKTIPSWFNLIEISFLPQEMKEQYIALINERAGRLGLVIV